jgi:Tfp pilus assembly protein PilZ
MENSTLKIEYRKFNSFLKDYVKNLNQGWIFLRMAKTYNEGTDLHFSFKVSELSSELKAFGTVVFSGVNSEGKKGVGIKLEFEEESKRFLEKHMPLSIKEKYGEVWGTKICNLLEEK